MTAVSRAGRFRVELKCPPTKAASFNVLFRWRRRTCKVETAAPEAATALTDT